VCGNVPADCSFAPDIGGASGRMLLELSARVLLTDLDLLSVAKSEIEQRCVIKFLCAKKFALDRVITESASVDGEQACAKKAVEYWIRQIKSGRLDMKDEARRERPPLGMLRREFWHASAMSHSPRSV
jgi:hypothetical protein